MRATTAYFLLGALLAGFAVYEVMLWRECLDTNSFFYCMRVLSK